MANDPSDTPLPAVASPASPAAPDADAARAARARARATWPIAVVPLHAPEVPDPDAWRYLWQTSVNAWLLAGKSLPTYTRAEMPGKVTRGRRDRE